MDPRVAMASGSARARPELEKTVIDSLQFNEEIRQLMNLPQESGNSFTALLELPATQAVQLLHTVDPGGPPGISSPVDGDIRCFQQTLTFPSDAGLVERAARFSVFAGEANGKISRESSCIPSNSSDNVRRVKSEPAETESSQPLVSDPLVENQNHRPVKRKEREKKVKSSTKKGKSNEKSSEDAEKLPYVHVRARRGQATDSHSLAERARREKINARMKLLQELVPGYNKISGTALVLDEIINHVQSLQRQVEFLSMRLAAVNPRIDFNLDNIVAADSGSFNDSNVPGVVMPVTWPELLMNEHRQQFQHQWQLDAIHQPVWGREQNIHNFIPPENSLLSYDDDSANSAAIFHNVKMEQ